MLFASVPRGIGVVVILCIFLVVDSLSDSPIGLGLKLSTQKGYYGYSDVLGIPLDL